MAALSYCYELNFFLFYLHLDVNYMTLLLFLKYQDSLQAQTHHVGPPEDWSDKGGNSEFLAVLSCPLVFYLRITLGPVDEGSYGLLHVEFLPLGLFPKVLGAWYREFILFWKENRIFW